MMSVTRRTTIRAIRMITSTAATKLPATVPTPTSLVDSVESGRTRGVCVCVCAIITHLAVRMYRKIVNYIIWSMVGKVGHK